MHIYKTYASVHHQIACVQFKPFILIWVSIFEKLSYSSFLQLGIWFAGTPCMSPPGLINRYTIFYDWKLEYISSGLLYLPWFIYTVCSKVHWKSVQTLFCWCAGAPTLKKQLKESIPEKPSGSEPDQLLAKINPESSPDGTLGAGGQANERKTLKDAVKPKHKRKKKQILQ